YKDVPPRLIAEKYLAEMGKEVINDYKFFCFSGRPKFVQIDIGRGIHNYRCFYDMDWNLQPFIVGRTEHYPYELLPPENFDEMMEVAEKLAGDFPFVRVDLYNIDGRILFGEMTFYPSDGRNEFRPEEFNRILGDYITLPEPAGI
ncbi:MAG: ATP-grasp fold amidoligase family protein, partial [Eudoraea sp.]|nr:ATP-grasp fold amidoligase family protein [Eudoraea sp.]